MIRHQQTITQENLDQLADRLKRGIPKWEQAAFLEQVVPQLVAKLQQYLKFDARS